MAAEVSADDRQATRRTKRNSLSRQYRSRWRETPDTWSVRPVLWEGGGREPAPYPISSPISGVRGAGARSSLLNRCHHVNGASSRPHLARDSTRAGPWPPARLQSLRAVDARDPRPRGASHSRPAAVL